MLSDISRTIFNGTVGDPLRRKAVAMAIYLKDRNTRSTYKDWTYRSLSRESGLSPNTTKKYVAELKAMRLAFTWERNGHRYITFRKLRKEKIKNKKNNLYHTPKFSDISLREIDHGSVKSIEKGLMALVIKDHAERADKVRHLIMLGTNPGKYVKLKDFKRAHAICRKKGYTKFVEKGFSYRMIRKKLHCGSTTVRNTIVLGESMGLYVAQRQKMVFIEYAGYGKAKSRLRRCRASYPTAFATFSNLYYQPPTIFLPIKG